MNSGFSFGNSGSKPPSSTASGFSFGSSTTGFSFAPKTTTQSAASGFSFGSGFNASSTTSAASTTSSVGLFGQGTGSQPSPFATASMQATAPSTGFSFAKPTTQGSNQTGFGFGATKPASDSGNAPTAGSAFGFGTSTPMTSGEGFNFGKQTSAQNIGFGNTVASSVGSGGFGGMTTSTGSASTNPSAFSAAARSVSSPAVKSFGAAPQYSTTFGISPVSSSPAVTSSSSSLSNHLFPLTNSAPSIIAPSSTSSSLTMSTSLFPNAQSAPSFVSSLPAFSAQKPKPAFSLISSLQNKQATALGPSSGVGGDGNSQGTGFGSASSAGTSFNSGTSAASGTGLGTAAGQESGIRLGSGTGQGSGLALGSGTGPGSGLALGSGTGPGSGLALGSGTGPGSGTGLRLGSGAGFGSGTGLGTGLGSGTGPRSGTGLGSSPGLGSGTGFDTSKVLGTGSGTEAVSTSGTSATSAAAFGSNSGLATAFGSSTGSTFGKNLGSSSTQSGTFQLGATKASSGTAATTGSGFQLSSFMTSAQATSSNSGTASISQGKSTAPGTFSLHKPAVAPTANSTSAFSTTQFNLPSTNTMPSTSVQTQTSSFKLSSSLSIGASSAASTSKPSALSIGLQMPSSTAVPSQSQASTSGLPTTVASAPTSIKYKDLETKINKWTGELEQQEHLFLSQATQVNAWNKLLIENSEKITGLNTDFEKVSCDQERLNQELDFIKTQQEELESLLGPLEESARQQVTSLASSVHTHHADVERERTYNLAENIDGQLKRMVQDLREVIDHVNASSSPLDGSNPVNQISKILSAHMDSLQWLDTNSGALQHKLDQLTKDVNDRKMEQESRFRLAFD